MGEMPLDGEAPLPARHNHKTLQRAPWCNLKVPGPP